MFCLTFNSIYAADMCPKPNATRNGLSSKSHVEDLEGIPGLFNALTQDAEDDGWTTFTYPVDFDAALYGNKFDWEMAVVSRKYNKTQMQHKYIFFNGRNRSSMRRRRPRHRRSSAETGQIVGGVGCCPSAHDQQQHVGGHSAGTSVRHARTSQRRSPQLEDRHLQLHRRLHVAVPVVEQVQDELPEHGRHQLPLVPRRLLRVRRLDVPELRRQREPVHGLPGRAAGCGCGWRG